MESHSPPNDLDLDSSRAEPDHPDGPEDEHVKQARALLSDMTIPQLRLVVFVIQGLMNIMNPVGRRRQILLESINDTLRMSAHFAIDAINLVAGAVNGEEEEEDEDVDDDDEDDDEQNKLLENDNSGNVAGDDEDEDNDNDEDDVEEEIEIDEDDDDDGDEEANAPVIPDEQKGFEDDDDDDEDVDVDRDLDVIDDAPGEDDDDDDEIDIEVQEHVARGGDMEEDEDEDEGHNIPHSGVQEQPVAVDDDDEELIEEEDDDEDDLDADADADASRQVDVALTNSHGDNEDLREHDVDQVGLDLENIGDVEIMDAAAGNGANLDSILNVVGDSEEVGEEDIENEDQTEAGRRKRKRSLFDAGDPAPMRQVRRLP